MLRAQRKSQLQSRQHRPLILGVEAETTRVHRFPRMKRIVLEVFRRNAIEEVSETGHDFGRHELGLVVVGDVVTAEVDAELHAVPPDGLGEIVYKLPLSYVPALREGKVIGIQAVRRSISRQVQ